MLTNFLSRTEKDLAGDDRTAPAGRADLQILDEKLGEYLPEDDNSGSEEVPQEQNSGGRRQSPRTVRPRNNDGESMFEVENLKWCVGLFGVVYLLAFLKRMCKPRRPRWGIFGR